MAAFKKPFNDGFDNCTVADQGILSRAIVDLKLTSGSLNHDSMTVVGVGKNTRLNLVSRYLGYRVDEVGGNLNL
jgi:hypothetical protein